MKSWIALAAVVGILLVAVNVLTGGVGSAANLPETDGQYPVQARSINYDGSAYKFIWLDPEGQGHSARSTRTQLQQDERTFLEMKDAQPVLHLDKDEPVTVHGRDQQGSFTSSWLPFAAGYVLGNMMSGPTYYYPPPDSITRGGTAYGGMASAKRETLDFDKTRGAASAVSGKNSGTGDGVAATNKPSSGSSAAIGGQAGGAGAGTAAASKSSSPNTAISGQAGGAGAGTAASGKSAATPGSIGGKPSTGFSSGAKPSLKPSIGKRR